MIKTSNILSIMGKLKFLIVLINLQKLSINITDFFGTSITKEDSINNDKKESMVIM